MVAVGAATVGAPYVHAQKKPIKWRLQTYAGPALAEHVIKPSIDAFNKIAFDPVTASEFPMVMTEFDPKLIMTSGLYGILKRSSISNQRGLAMVKAL